MKYEYGLQWIFIISISFSHHPRITLISRIISRAANRYNFFRGEIRHDWTVSQQSHDCNANLLKLRSISIQSRMVKKSIWWNLLWNNGKYKNSSETKWKAAQEPTHKWKEKNRPYISGIVNWTWKASVNSWRADKRGKGKRMKVTRAPKHSSNYIYMMKKRFLASSRLSLSHFLFSTISMADAISSS